MNGPVPPERWLRADGTTVACTESIKVLEENWHEAVELLQAVVLVGILHGGAHQFSQVLLLAVAGHAHGLGLVVAELSQYGLDHLPDEVVFQRHLSLLPNILLLAHDPAVG